MPPMTESVSNQKSVSDSPSLMLLMISGEGGVGKMCWEAEQHEQRAGKDDIRDFRAGFESVREGVG